MSAETPSRRDAERALRTVKGISARMARRFISKAWAELVGEREAERVELEEQLAELQRQLRARDQ